MDKTGSEIEEYLYKQATKLKKAINGDVYRNGTRPRNSDKEDIVVIFLDGVTGQIQLSEALVNAYVPDKLFNGFKTKDFKRCGELSDVLNKFAADLPQIEYKISKSGVVNVLPFEDIGQHCVTLRLKLKNNTF